MKKDINIDALKTAKKKAREEEIAFHGKLISTRPSVQKSKKLYSRKNYDRNYED